MSNIENLTVAQLRGLDAINPRLALTGRQLISNSADYDYFVEVLYETIDSCIRSIEEDPKVRGEDGEDRLTTEIIGMLRQAGYAADHDAAVGGHSDIVVKSLRGDCWVGEAKIHSGYDYLEKGWNQLTTRYLRGTPGYDKGGFLIYVRNRDCASVIDKWKNHLVSLSPASFHSAPCPTRKELGFYTEHLHGSGRKVFIRHIGIHLHWDPE